MFVTRLLSGIVLVLAAIFLTMKGGLWLLSALCVLSFVGIYELLRVFGLERTPLAIVSYCATAAYYACLYLSLLRWLPVLLISAMGVMLFVYVARYPRLKIGNVTNSLFAVFYVGVLLSFIYQTRCLEQGLWLVWLIIIGAWGSDTCAYVAGVAFGRHHFSELSPKKTVEGCIGGVVGAGLIGFIYSFFFPDLQMFHLGPQIVFSLVSVAGAVISQVGDLVASAMKRNYKVKDYGDIIPGHGGVLDRFDSVIFVAPFVYYLLVLTSYVRF